jgi:L,D-peptidoglycan transpeptidase YkuD (ErfK/YbiS/YcfS/YnhG family)
MALHDARTLSSSATDFGSALFLRIANYAFGPAKRGCVSLKSNHDAFESPWM